MKPDWGNPDVRNFRGGGGNTGHSEDAVRLRSTRRRPHEVSCGFIGFMVRFITRSTLVLPLILSRAYSKLKPICRFFFGSIYSDVNSLAL